MLNLVQVALVVLHRKYQQMVPLSDDTFFAPILRSTLFAEKNPQNCRAETLAVDISLLDDPNTCRHI